MNAVLIGAVAAIVVVGTAGTAASSPPPACRVDSSWSGPVRDAVTRAARVFREARWALPFESISVNPATRPREGTLTVFVIRDATVDRVDRSGCPKPGAPSTTAERVPDQLSVTGACHVVADARSEIRCSAKAMRAFAGTTDTGRSAGPALLYIMAHEIAHLHQGRRGEFAGRIERIALRQPREAKIEQLRTVCEPQLITAEEQADAMALDVVARSVAHPPYREPVLTERGSFYWSIDRIRLAANEWEAARIRQVGHDRASVHRAFVPTEFPSLPANVAAAARRFVCDALRRGSGELSYPARHTTHPAPEQRLRRLAERLGPIADTLPVTGGSRDFKAVAELQQSLSPVLTHIYRETGVYLDAVHEQICSLANSDRPDRACD